MSIISAPTIIVSIDSSVDTSILFGVNEEEEKEDFKLLFEITSQNIEDDFDLFTMKDNLGYKFKTYQKPHLNLISPPPEFIL